MNHYFRAFITLVLIEAFTAAGTLFAQTNHPVLTGNNSTLPVYTRHSDSTLLLNNNLSDSLLKASEFSNAITFPLSFLQDGKKVIPVILVYNIEKKRFTDIIRDSSTYRDSTCKHNNHNICSERDNSCERLSQLEVFKNNGELFRRYVFLYGLDRNNSPQLSSVQSWGGDGSYIKSILFSYDSIGHLTSVEATGKQNITGSDNQNDCTEPQQKNLCNSLQELSAFHSGDRKLEKFYCSSTLMNISLDEQGDCFMFDKERGFLSRVKAEGISNKMILFSGLLEEPVIVSFADPVEDPENITTGTRVEMVTKDAIFGSLEKVEITPTDIGLFNGASFLKRQSNYGGKLDFAVNGQHQIYGNVLYVTKTPLEGVVAHNNFNYGNFLWGVTAAVLHIPIGLARLGAHINNFFFSPDSRGKLDSDDDQYSITIGHHWYTTNKKK